MYVDWTHLSEVVEPHELLSKLVDSIYLFLEVPYNRFLLQAIKENYDTLVKGLKI